MLRIARLACENDSNPVGIDEVQPRFSWILESDRQNVIQRFYQLQLASDGAFKNIVWDSGRTESDQSVFAVYTGPELKPSTRYYYRVFAEDNYGDKNDECPPAFFETGLMTDGDWPAAFISPAEETNAESSCGWYLTKSFKARADIACARIYATALGVYKLSVNGRECGSAEMAPGWTSYKSRLLYQTYDISTEIKTGSNEIRAHIGPGWYKGNLAGWVGKRNLYGNRTGFSAIILIRYQDGSEETVLSDSTWLSGASPVVYSEIYNGEIYDARKENEALTNTVDVLDFDTSVVCCQDGPVVQAQEVFSPQKILKDSQGRTILDFGQNMTGWVRFRTSGSAGSAVVLKHAEILTPEGDLYTENLRSAKQEIRYILSGSGIETYRPHFTFQGFRYVLIEEYPGKPEPRNFEAVVLHSEMEPTLKFECSDKLLNQLNRNIHWGMKGNFLDIPTDCPQRDERLGWTGDAQVFISTACSLRNASGFFRKWLRDVHSEQQSGGEIPHVVPDVLRGVEETDELQKSSHSACGWADAAVICPWEIYRQYGDGRIIREHYPMMKKWVGYIESRARDGVIWDSGFHFGDWVALDAEEGSYFGATPNDFTATVFYANSVRIVSEAAALLGQKEDQKKYKTLYSRIKSAFREEYFDTDGGLKVPTQTAHALALYFELTPDKSVDRVSNDLVNLIRSKNDHLTTGFLGTPYLCAALSRSGRPDMAYKLLMQQDYPSWLYQVKQGATTIWEHWDGLKPDGSLWSPDMNSFNHYAYGAVGYWMYTNIAGIDLPGNVPGFKEIVFKPLPGGGIDFVSAERITPYGTARIQWQLDGDKFSAKIDVPCNTTARILLPGRTEEIRTGSGRHEFEVQ